ncbi:hypothetical protein L6452_12333 [Arctium lappa]|uniref:Uncharacterized protein n=1 Tax=Arctium lappa TaxID=4217 RepID=A0ACB9DQS8_ARCLA|nr:hypothetical protein L6452_12333 [Arctium lappa]
MTQLLYAENTVWESDDLETNVAPLQKWSMELLRKRQTDAIKRGGFHIAMTRDIDEVSLKSGIHNGLKRKLQPTNAHEGGRADCNLEGEGEVPNLFYIRKTTYDIIDAQILEKSGGKLPSDEGKGTATCKPTSYVVEPASNSIGTNLQIVPVTEPDEQPVPISQCDLDIPIPSFHLGISPPKPPEERPSRKGKEAISRKEAPT